MTIKSVSQKKYTTRRQLSRTCTKLSKGKKHRSTSRNTRHVRGIRKTPLGRVALLKHKQKQSKRKLLRSTRNLLTSQQQPWKHLRGGMDRTQIGQVCIENLNRTLNGENISTTDLNYHKLALFKVLRQQLNSYEQKFFDDYTVHYSETDEDNPQVIVVFFLTKPQVKAKAPAEAPAEAPAQFTGNRPMRSVVFDFEQEKNMTDYIHRLSGTDATAQPAQATTAPAAAITGRQPPPTTIATPMLTVENIGEFCIHLTTTIQGRFKSEPNISIVVKERPRDESIPDTNISMDGLIEQIQSDNESKICKGLEDILSTLKGKTSSIISYTLDFAAKQGIMTVVNLMESKKHMIDVVIEILETFSRNILWKYVPELPRVVISAEYDRCWDILFKKKKIITLSSGNEKKHLLSLKERVTNIIGNKKDVTLMVGSLRQNHLRDNKFKESNKNGSCFENYEKLARFNGECLSQSSKTVDWTFDPILLGNYLHAKKKKPGNTPEFPFSSEFTNNPGFMIEDESHYYGEESNYSTMSMLTREILIKLDILQLQLHQVRASRHRSIDNIGNMFSHALEVEDVETLKRCLRENCATDFYFFDCRRETLYAMLHVKDKLIEQLDDEKINLYCELYDPENNSIKFDCQKTDLFPTTEIESAANSWTGIVEEKTS